VERNNKRAKASIGIELLQRSRFYSGNKSRG
jgi:hypothetical protein